VMEAEQLHRQSLEFPVEGPFGSKENQRIFVGIQSIGKETRCYVWNGRNRRSVPQERKLRVCMLQESKNPLRVKGKKGSLFLRLCLSRSLSVWFPAIQTTTILVFCVLNSCDFLIFLIPTFFPIPVFFIPLFQGKIPWKALKQMTLPSMALENRDALLWPPFYFRSLPRPSHYICS
jgi:hypothetical protein